MGGKITKTHWHPPSATLTCHILFPHQCKKHFCSFIQSYQVDARITTFQSQQMVGFIHSPPWHFIQQTQYIGRRRMFPKSAWCQTIKMCSDTFCDFLISAGLSTLAHCQHALFVKHFPAHFASLPDPWAPADPFPPACGGPWWVEVEAPLLLTL